MAHTVFFSWQSDTPNNYGRNFIEKALGEAIKQLKEDVTVDPAIRDEGLAVDRDTKGVPGTPPIVDTIFRKIDTAAAFLVDLTFVGARLDGRPTPNPNVLLEYGWALKSLGHGRMIVVMNTAHGIPTDATMPFNMKHLRKPIQYCLPADSAENFPQVRSQLTADFKGALRDILESADFRESLPLPPEPPRFQPQPEVGSGPARFRRHGEPIGVLDSRFGFSSADSSVKLEEGPSIWLRVMPEMKPNREWSIAELKQLVGRAGLIIYPLGWASSWGYVRGSDGFGYVPTDSSNNLTQVQAVSFAFKSGELWTIFAGLSRLMENNGAFPNFEGMLTECFLRFAHFLREGLQLSLPYRWIAGIEGIKGKRMQRIPPPGRHYIEAYSGTCLDNLVSDTGMLQDGEDERLALAPFFRKLCDSCGEDRGAHMDQFLLHIEG